MAVRARLPWAADMADRWLLLIHQIPPKPDYFRVKVRRRLHQLGAIAIKNSVYVLPLSDESLEDFQWLAREIEQEGGEATVCAASFVTGLSDEEVQQLFQSERDAAYQELSQQAQAAMRAGDKDGVAAELPRLKRQLADIVRKDFFGAPLRRAAEDVLAEAERTLDAGAAQEVARGASGRVVSGRTWVTRRGVLIDRVASAWLIRRFIDPDAHFVFVDPREYKPNAGEVRFDMFEAEYTHEGDRCTFETLLARFSLRDRALRAISQIVHDIDCKDEKFGRAETMGVAALINGIARAHEDDASRIERAAAVFDDLYASFQRGRR
jgi:hypothetical protein